MENKVLKPKIRFKGFADTWEQRKVGEFGELITGTTPSTSDVNNYNGDYLFVSPADIQGNRFVKNTITTLSEKGFCKCRRLKADSVLFVSIGSTIGKVAQIKEIAVTNQQINAIIPNEKYNPNFVYSLLENKAEDIKKQASAQAVPIINKTTFGEIECFVTTSKEEQTKISKILLNIDNLITLHQSKYDKLVNVKKALLEKMFPKDGKNVPEIRFKGFTDTWEQRKLKDFGTATGGTSIESEFSDDGIYKVISIGSYSEQSKYNDQGIRAIHSDKTKVRVLNKDDLTIILNDKTASGRIIGRALLIDKSGEYVYNQRTERIETDTKKYTANFLYQLLNAPNIRSKIIKQSQGNTQIFVNWTAIQNTEYDVPNKAEQIKLARLFDNIDNLITLHQHKLEKLKNMKKSLLNKMFI